MIKPVSYSTILDDPNWPALLAEYAAECSIPELGEPSPQRDLYEMLEKSGGFQAFGVYEDEKLVGFACVLIYVLPHYGKKVATTESVFASRKVGRLGVGLDLLNFIEVYAIGLGCANFIYSAPLGSRFDHMLDARKRARHSNNTYVVSL